MAIASLGFVTIGAVAPVTAGASLAITTSVNISLPDIQLRADGIADVQAALTITPPTLAGTLSVATDLVANVQAAIAAAPPLPDVNVDFLASLGVELSALTASLGTLNAQLAIAANINALLAVGNIAAYTYSGAVGSLGGEFSVELSGGLPGGGPGDPANAVLLVTTNSVSWSAMQEYFGV